MNEIEIHFELTSVFVKWTKIQKTKSKKLFLQVDEKKKMRKEII